LKRLYRYVLIHPKARCPQLSSKSVKEGRLIVRNVGFRVNVEQIRKRFEDYGELIDVSLPPSKKTEEKGTDGKVRRIPLHAGYAFVEFDTREQAQTAILAVNGNRIGGRPVAVDFAYDSRLYKAIQNKGVKIASKSIRSEGTSVTSIEQVTAEVRKTKLPESMTTPNKKQKIIEPEETRKLFLINIPFEATRADIEKGICEFAKIDPSHIESVLIIKDRVTCKSNGKAFIILSSIETATNILALEQSSTPFLFGGLYKKKDIKSAPIEGAGCLVLGRRISIMKPLSKAELDKQKQEKEEQDDPKNPKIVNRKNIDYINAGWINESSPEWFGLSEKDQKLRSAMNEEKKFKIKNSNYIINTKRLTIRNIPKKMENGDLMLAVLKAMGVSGPKKVKQAGIKKVAIVKDKLMVPVNGGDRQQTEQDFDMNIESSDDEGKSIKRSPTDVKMKEKKKSRGFAFIDFVDSNKAMDCLVSMNNIAGAFGPNEPTRRPIVEFSFDDVRKLQIQKQRALKQEGKKSLAEEPVISKVKKIGRGQKQRMKKRAARESAGIGNSSISSI
jgi:RNA recognition motif-containing protein